MSAAHFFVAYNCPRGPLHEWQPPIWLKSQLLADLLSNPSQEALRGKVGCAWVVQVCPLPGAGLAWASSARRVPYACRRHPAGAAMSKEPE